MLNLTSNSLESLHAAARQAQAATDLPRAQSLYHQVLALNPHHLEALLNLAHLLQHLGRFNEALPLYQKVLQLQPDNPIALNNSAVILQRFGFTDLALAAYRHFVAILPDNPAGHSNLGTALHDAGLTDQALASLRRALQLDPNMVPAYSAYLLILQYHPDYDAPAILAESRRWNDTLVRRLAQPFTIHPNSRDPHRRLRIGYVSADFRDHSVGRFMLPLLAHHNHAHFEIFCYFSSPAADDFTARLRSHADTWRDVAPLSDPDLAALIRKDQIDILIDLAMHTHGGRPLLFARKPAPLQLTYLAYPGVTGLATIDYRLTDPHLDPPDAPDPLVPQPSGSASLELVPRPLGSAQSTSEKSESAAPHHSESPELPLRLQSYWCYQPPAEAPPPAPLPALQNHHLTFGCLNNFTKVSDRALETWAALLASIPNSHLLLFCPEGDARTRVQSLFARHHIPPQNLAFVSRGPFLQYLQHYHRIDIALDPFPYCGGTTTCDALYMGVPVITLRGNKPVSRAGASILSNAGGGGHPELIANTPEEYIHLAQQLAANLPALSTLRQSLRRTLQSSPLMNAPQCTQTLEQAYRQIWQSWCKTEPVA